MRARRDRGWIRQIGTRGYAGRRAVVRGIRISRAGTLRDHPGDRSPASRGAHGEDTGSGLKRDSGAAARRATKGTTMPDSKMRVLLGRREFLRRLSALSGAAASSSALRALAATPNPSAPLHVIIAGAGLAGL